ncbi:MAG: porphobilinogen synthase [Thermoleophilia bacterium]
MYYPSYRMRRLRQTEQIRNLVHETDLLPDRLIYPLFVSHGQDVRQPIESMPGCYQLSINNLVEEAKVVRELGIQGVILFGIPAEKDEAGTAAYDEEGVVQMALSALKEEVPRLLLITDVCLCEYTSHGHCGIVRDGAVDNDITLEMLAKMALSHAEAGADIVAPSDMMDGRVAAIRNALDGENFINTPIMSYAAKYASAYYGPFREAADSTPEFGDRRSYQMDARNSDEALREVYLDIEEGADIVMVKPALPYLDIIYRVKQETKFPVAAYNVSGEYAMVKAAAEKGWLDERRVVLENLGAIRRAGADIIITYHAKDAARWLGK